MDVLSKTKWIEVKEQGKLKYFIKSLKINLLMGLLILVLFYEYIIYENKIVLELFDRVLVDGIIPILIIVISTIAVTYLTWKLNENVYDLNEKDNRVYKRYNTINNILLMLLLVMPMITFNPENILLGTPIELIKTFVRNTLIGTVVAVLLGVSSNGTLIRSIEKKANCKII